MLDGEKWTDVLRFKRVLGDGGAQRRIHTLTAETAQAELEASAALGNVAGGIRHLLGDE